jgi:two-component system, LuxR family, response regulator FixJ
MQAEFLPGFDNPARHEGRRRGKILIATNDAAHRAAVSRFLAGRDYSFVVAETVTDMLVHLRGGGIELVVAAMLGPDADGLELMRLVREMLPGMPVIVLALGGAEIDPLHLDCATGLNREVTQGQNEVRSRLASLTARERQVLELIVAGRANKIIAYELSISPRTVENHRARVMEKLRAKSVADLVRMALSAGAMKSPIANDTGRCATA